MAENFVFFGGLFSPQIIPIKDVVNLRRNPPDVGVKSGQKPCTKIIYIVLQTSIGLF